MIDPISAGMHVLNIALIVPLIYVYVQNYRHMKSRLTLGLIIFASMFLVHTILGLAFDIVMVMYSTPGAQLASMTLELIKTASFAVLLWISME